MKILYKSMFSLLFVLVTFSTMARAASLIDCNFNDKRSFCDWKREWYEMRRAGWRSGKRIPGVNLADDTKIDGGKFAYFRSRSRPTGFRSRIRSAPILASSESCFVFRMAMGGAQWKFPDGNSLLRLYLVESDAPVENAVPIWTNGERTPRNGQFTQIVIPLYDAIYPINSISSQFVFETIRGGSKKCYVVIDDISLQRCDDVVLVGNQLRKSPVKLEMEDEAMKKITDVKKEMIRLMLPAQRPDAGVKYQQATAVKPLTVVSSNGGITTHAIRLSARGEFFPLKRISAKVSKKGRRRRKKAKKGKKRRKGRKKIVNKRRNKIPNNFDDHGFGSVYLEEPTDTHSSYYHPPSSSTLPLVCDFIEYTQRLQRCFRSFFSILDQQPNTCNSRYMELESCIQLAATLCVPPRDMDPMRVEEIVLGTLRNTFKTKQVFCEEEGAFVFPEFAIDKVPIQCGSRYFIKLSECSGSFSSMFHLRHGNPKLCREYYRANECQRRTTAEECNFDTETLLMYGLNLQYQFAYNPFCVHLPFSAWWPHS